MAHNSFADKKPLKKEPTYLYAIAQTIGMCSKAKNLHNNMKSGRVYNDSLSMSLTITFFCFLRAAQCQSGEQSSTFSKFLQHLKDRLDLMDQEHSNEFHGEINFAVVFGYIYIVDPPPSFVEDPEGLTLDQLNTALQHSRRNNLPPRLSETMLGAKITSVSSKCKLIPKKPTLRGSFYSGVCGASTDEIEALLCDMGFGLQSTEDVFKVILFMPDCQMKAVYNHDLEFINSFTSNTIWLHTDVKRKGPGSNSDKKGNNCDIRFQIRTRKFVQMEGIQASGLKDLLSWKSRASKSTKDGSNLNIKSEFRSQVSFPTALPPPRPGTRHF